MAASIPPHPSPAPAPAYAAAPRRSGLLYAIAGIVALAALVATALYLFGGRSASPVDMPADLRASDAQKALESAKAALAQASKDVLNPASTPQPTADPAPALPAAAPPPTVEPPRVAATAEPPRPVQRPPAAPAAPKASSTPPRAPVPEPAAVAAPVPAPPVQVASAERWTQMRNEMAGCSTTSLIPRIQCEQRIRARYCDGWWGTVPDCPTSSGRRG